MRWKGVAIASAIAVAALALRLWNLGTPGLSIDEADSFRVVSLRWAPWAFQLNVPPLYHVLLKSWSIVFGAGEAGVRSLSVLLGTLSVVVTMVAARRAFGARAALWSGTFAAVAPIHLYYSREARPYALLILSVGLTQAALWRALERNDRWSWVGFHVAAIAAVASHPFAVFALAALASWPLLWPERGRLVPLAAPMAIGGALLLVWLLAYVRFADPLGNFAWVAEIWRAIPPVMAIPRSLEAFVLGTDATVFPVSMKQFDAAYPSELRVFGLAVAVALAIWLYLPKRQRLAIPWIGRRKAMVTVALLGPLATMWLVSFVQPIYIPARYDVVSFPAFALLAGLAIAELGARRKSGWMLAPAAALALAVPIAAKLAIYDQAPDRQGFRRTARALLDRVGERDTVIFTELRGFAILYQLDRLGYRWETLQCRNRDTGKAFGCRMFPIETEREGTAYRPERVLADPEGVRKDVDHYLHDRGAPPSTIHVVLGRFATTSDGRLAATHIDKLLIDELRRASFRSVSANVEEGILTYRR